MDKYAVFGLLLIAHLGQAQVNIYFHSPVEEGDDVNITCTWHIYEDSGYTGNDWYRRTIPYQHTYLYALYSNGSVKPQPKFEYVSHNYTDIRKSHTMKLVGAQVSDTGMYGCHANFANGYQQHSNEKQLSITAVKTPTASQSAASTTMITQPTATDDASTTSHPTTVTSGSGKTLSCACPSVGVVAGSVACGVVVLVAVNVAVFVCLLRRKRNTQEEPEMVENDVYAGRAGDSMAASNDDLGNKPIPSQKAEGPFSYIPEQTVSAKASSGAGHPSADGKPQGEQARQAPKAVSGTALQDAQGNSSDENAAKKTRKGKAVAEKKATQSAQATRVGKQTTDVDARVSGAKRATAVPQYANVDRLMLPDTKPKADDADQEAQYDTIDDTMMQEDEDVAKNEITNDKAKQHKRNHGNQPSKFAESKDSNEAQYAQVDEAKKKPAAKEATQNLKHTNDANAIRKMPAKYEHPEVQYAQVDKSKKTTAAKETNQVVHHAQVDDTKKQQNATEVNEEAQHAQAADKTEKESGPREGSHYAQVAATGDGKGVVVRTVPDTEYSAVTLSAKADQEVDSDSD